MEALIKPPHSYLRYCKLQGSLPRKAPSLKKSVRNPASSNINVSHTSDLRSDTLSDVRLVQ
ncbi:hypothetical protein MGG_15558 [Pyricularia oryzae 70-15]|uniref:Uncharacterized protein n=3 Tax=Pyricularia oryzae TaxID=318829 RepID=G4MTC6_PYRO7|nr:uncharacterized protein MGG_15558 [Pyricularia oryzae 70-15]EHA53872.1 hypothetical protein MGG_15558 [Pyricularia oryzae 70-15]ELQ42781.1 hypothetical protein OOU_Y34scaffold00194g94 [Pyricularia oryzae Y34]